METPTTWIVDRDIPSKEATKKRFHRVPSKASGRQETLFSICYDLSGWREARAFFDIAKRYAQYPHLYEVERVKGRS